MIFRNTVYEGEVLYYISLTVRPNIFFRENGMEKEKKRREEKGKKGREGKGKERK